MIEKGALARNEKLVGFNRKSIRYGAMTKRGKRPRGMKYRQRSAGAGVRHTLESITAHSEGNEVETRRDETRQRGNKKR